MLGYLPQEFGVYPKMSASDMLHAPRHPQRHHFDGRTQGNSRCAASARPISGTRAKNLSRSTPGGMKQRFGIAQALLANPKLIIVDEPTAGLDPAERNRFLNLLSSIGRSVTVILSTHIVDDVRELCSRMAIIAPGESVHGRRTCRSAGRARGTDLVAQSSATDEELRRIESRMNEISYAPSTGGHHEIRVLRSPRQSWRQDSVPVACELEDVYFLQPFASHEKLETP